MKIRLLIGIIFFSVCTNEAISQKVNFGIKAGADVHKIVGKSFDEEFKFGYHAGAFLEIKGKRAGLQPEVYFSQVNASTGKTISDINPSLNDVKKIKLTYLNIPVLVNLYFNKNVALQVGPQYGILVNQEISGQSNVENAFKKGDFSMVGGLQIKISRFKIYGRYVAGLNDKNDLKSATDQSKWKSQTLHFGIGYAIL